MVTMATCLSWGLLERFICRFGGLYRLNTNNGISSHRLERGGHLRVFIPFGSVWIYLDRGPFGFKAWNRSQHICLLDSACLWFGVHGFLIELAKLSTDSLRLKLNRNGWVLVSGSNDQFSFRSRTRRGLVLHFRVLVERHDSQIKMFTEPLHMSLTLLICYGRLGLLKGDIAHCQTSFAFHSWNEPPPSNELWMFILERSQL